MCIVDVELICADVFLVVQSSFEKNRLNSLHSANLLVFWTTFLEETLRVFETELSCPKGLMRNPFDIFASWLKSSGEVLRHFSQDTLPPALSFAEVSFSHSCGSRLCVKHCKN